MCGIFGVINFNGNHIDEQRLIRARDSMFHRGPDDEGLFINSDRNVGFGFRRLSIIDLSPGGHQPMSSQDGRFTIVFNGEIYNYKELGKRLEARGEKLHTNSDTEALLRLFILEGAECLSHLRGMFAFAIWDEKEKSLFAARDRFGIKPFYYSYSFNEFIFSSEIKGIRQYGKSLTTSIKAVDAFLKTGSIPNPLTIYKEIFSLSAGNYLTVKDNKYEIREYWTLQHHLKENIGNCSKRYDKNSIEIIKGSLLSTAEAHCVSDVEVGAFLSGGIDSTAVVALMNEKFRKKIKTISVVFPGQPEDESKYAQLAAQKFATDHFEYYLQEEEVLEDLEKIFDFMDQPTIDGVNTYFVSKAANNFGLKVVLSGLGGDELFGGYPSFKLFDRLELLRRFTGNKILKSAADSLLTLKYSRRRYNKLYEYLNHSTEQTSSYKFFRTLFTDQELLNLDWKHFYLHPFDSMDNEFDSLVEELETNNLDLIKILLLESNFYMRNQLLRDSDIFSMAHSLELRVPFIDTHLYNAVIPYLQRGFRAEKPKRILTDAVPALPYEIINRPKMGFTFPFDSWFRRGKLSKKLFEMINDKKINSTFEKRFIDDLYKDYLNKQLHWSKIWSIAVLSNYLG